MSNARFWFVPLKDLAPAAQQAQLAARDEVHANDLPASFDVPSKLFKEGIRAGHVLALHDGNTVTALARLLSLESKGTLHWRRLPMLEAPQLAAMPELREIKATEAQQFKIGIDAILRDVPNQTAGEEAQKNSEPRYWKIAPGEKGIAWPEWKQRGIAAIGWPLLGDLTQLSEAEFQSRSKTHYDKDKRTEGPYQVWTFRGIRPGDRVIANNGTRAILGVGTVTEGYRFRPGEHFVDREDFAHQIKVRWDDTQPRDIFQPNWTRTLLPLTREKFDALVGPAEVVPFTETEPQNIILYGPPGTGKTYSVWERSLQLLGVPDLATLSRAQVHAAWEQKRKAGQIVFCTFHQAFAYEEFVEGLRAETDEEGTVRYEVKPGIFKRIALKAAQDPQQVFVLVIDEINRANIARVFGELITLLEPDKRLGNPNALRVQLPASGEWFGVPPNLHVIGTMNTADRSIALMDVALRRRFTFEEMMPDARALEKHFTEQKVDGDIPTLVVNVFTKLNERLRFLYDREHQMGHAYFLDVRSYDDLRRVFATKIIPLLQEYFFGHWEKVALALGHPHTKTGPVMRGPKEKTILTVEKSVEKTVLGFDHDDYEDQIAWEVHPAFRPRGSFDGWSDPEKLQVFQEVAGNGKSG